MNNAVAKILMKYKYVLKYSDTEFWVTNEELPFSDDAAIDIYTLLVYDKLPIEKSKWIAVSELIQTE